MIVCIDGIDGVGKTTVVNALRQKFPQHIYQDTGLPSILAYGLNSDMQKADVNIILYCSLDEVINRKDDIDKSSLSYYYLMFKQLAETNSWPFIDSERDLECVIREIGEIICSQL